MKKKRKFQIGLLFLVFLTGMTLFSLTSKADTYSLDEAGDADSIGKFGEEYAYVGVKVLWDDELECFAVDTYKKNSYDYYEYQVSNINGVRQRVYNSRYSAQDSPIHLTHVNDQTGRFKVRASMIRNGRTDLSVITEIYVKGELTDTIYEIAGAASGEFDGNVFSYASSIRNETVCVGGHYAEQLSYVYRVYSPRIIEPDGDEISLETHNGKMTETGKAYVHKNGGLVLTKLPVAEMSREGYDCKLLGWYSAKDGGTKYEVGDKLKKGDVLHARWSVTPKKYDVTCIDIHGNDPKGDILGQSTWQAEYGTTVTGETKGTNAAIGAYYPNCIYSGATKSEVTTKGATVYRYFSYRTFPVEYVDVIKGGERDGEVINRTTKEKEYLSVVKGGDMGIDRAQGAYYEGYYYDSCTTEMVRSEGVTVKRYFKPITYEILLDGNGAQTGIMTTTYSCEYDKEVTLKINRFDKRSTVSLFQNIEKNAEETTEITVRQKFLGWSTEKNGTVEYSDNATLKNITNKSKTITLYAVWSEETVDLPEISAPLGYRFLGWAENPEAKKGFQQIRISDSKELYAVFERNIVSYHVEYYKENAGGEYELTSSYKFEGYVGDEVKLSPEDNVYPGYVLDTTSSTISGIIRADGSLILCAYYRRNSYDFSYELNGGFLQSGEIPEKSKIRFGTNISITAMVPEKEGYVFLGWCQETDASHTIFQARDTFIMQNHDVVMHAQWKRTSFSIKYNNNANGSMITGIAGEVPDTDYVYQKDSYASKNVFQAENGTMCCWNTKPDGSGISILPGANIKGMFDSFEELILYAIWESESATKETEFKVSLFEEKEEKKELLATLRLSGKAGEKASIALLRKYQEELQGEDICYFYKGYEVVNTEALDELISVNSDTEIVLYVKERECKIAFDTDNELGTVTGKYQEKYRLPESLSDKLKVDRYTDEMGNHYFPGEEIVLEKNIKLTIEQAVYIHNEFDAEQKKILYVIRGKDFTLPEVEKNGYRFLGWYDASGKLAGLSGEIIKNITERCDYYASWSEPLTYSVTFDMDGMDIKILEGAVSYHQYTKETRLPGKEQIIVPEGYEFEGWYDSRDTKKTLLTKLSATTYGDIILKPYLSKKKENEEDSDKSENNTENSDKENAGNADDKNSTEENNGNADNENSAGENAGNNNNGNSAGENMGVTGNENSDGENGSGILDNQNKDNSLKKDPNISKGQKKGDIFWKGKLKYKILSVSEGKQTVAIVGVKKNIAKKKIPSKVLYGTVTYKVTEIGKKAFYKANNLQEIVISDSIVKIKKSAFSSMKKLKKVTIGTNVKKIESKAFYKDKNLRKVIVKSKKITAVGKKAFVKLHGKVRIQLPKGKKKAYRKLFLY